MCTLFPKLCVEFNDNIAIVTQVFKFAELTGFYSYFYVYVMERP